MQAANSGHPGLPLDAAAMAYAPWTRFLNHNPGDPGWIDRDRFVLSAGHGSALLHALLHLTGYPELTLDQLRRFRQWRDAVTAAQGRAAALARLGLPPQIAACLFDLDGVLTRTATLHAAAWKQVFDPVLAARGQPAFDAVAEYARYVDGRPREDGVRALLAARGLAAGDDEVRAIAARKDERFERVLRERPVETYPGSVRYLRAARGAGLPVAVVSSSKHTQDVLRSAGLADLFDARIDGVIAEQRQLAGKPAPDTYLAAADALAVAPAQAAVFEDALAGVEAGRAGRFGHVVGVDRAGQAAELRRHGADVVVADLAALLEAA